MQAICLRAVFRRYRGFSPVIALIAIAILVLLVVLGKRYVKMTQKDPDLYYDLKPWKEWRLREASEKPIPEPLAEMPKITENLKFDTNLREKESEDPRGELTLYIDTDGSLGGSWHGFYHKGRKRSFQIMNGSFGGRMYPGKIYRDDAGVEDRTKLYLMAAGDFLVQEADSDKGTMYNSMGKIYVQGWLDTEYVLSGEVTITSDEDYFETFTWRTFRAP